MEGDKGGLESGIWEKMDKNEGLEPDEARGKRMGDKTGGFVLTWLEGHACVIGLL